MAEAQVKFFLQRLESLLFQRTEVETFAGLNDRLENTKGLIRKIAELIGEKGSRESDAEFCIWIDKIKDIVCDLDDLVDEFIIQIDKQTASDILAFTEDFRGELQKIESGLVETIQGISELDISTITKEENEGSKEESHEQEGQTSSASSSIPFKLKYNSLPYYLQSCLMYCCIFPENYWMLKGKLIRLLVAEGLVQEKTDQIWEHIAEEYLSELVRQGMLQMKDDHPGSRTAFAISPPYRMLLREYFKTSRANSNSTIPRTARRVLASDMRNIGQSLNNFRPRSLFIFGNQENFEGYWLDLTWAKYLRVLDLEDTKIKSLPDEVGDLIHLTYLGLKQSQINQLPETLGKLRALQTLDIRWCWRLSALPLQILNLVQLRHLKMSYIEVNGMMLPPGIGELGNLLTLTGLQAGDSIAGELDKLTQLTRLGVANIAEDNASQAYASIMKMKGLLCLSLEAHHAFNTQELLVLESLSPPPLLRKLRLEGALVKIPSWLGSMVNLTKLRLGFSHLSESPMSVLQLLPELKILTLWHAYDAKFLGREFCKAGGFPKLEVLSIASHVLEEWTEVEVGALPSLQYLHFHNCLRLRMLPEGLQFVTSLKQLNLLPLLDEHAERLKPDSGDENYKIRHIAHISFIRMSVLSSIPHPCRQSQESFDG